MPVSLGLLAALGAAVAYAVGTVLQARGTRRAAGLRALRQPLVLLGLACDGLGLLLALVAYGRLPLFVVQGVVASSVVGVVLLAVPVLGARLRRSDAAGVGVAVVGLALLAASAAEQPPSRRAGGSSSASWRPRSRWCCSSRSPTDEARPGCSA